MRCARTSYQFIVTYRVSVFIRKITADRATAIEAVIHHNLDELIQLGKTCTWSAEERAYLGLEAPAYGKELEPYA